MTSSRVQPQLPGRLDRAFIENASDVCRLSIDIRYDDIDTFGHVNNAASVIFLQEGRSALQRPKGFNSINGIKALVAGLTVEYAAEMYWPGTVEVRSGIAAIGSTSFSVAQTILQDGRTCIYGVTVMVFADADGPRPIPADYRTALEALKKSRD